MKLLILGCAENTHVFILKHASSFAIRCGSYMLGAQLVLLFKHNFNEIFFCACTNGIYLNFKSTRLYTTRRY